MIEVFRTNVEEHEHAQEIVDKIHRDLTDHKANFDLEDCDRILRVKCANGVIRVSCLIGLLNECGFRAEILPDA